MNRESKVVSRPTADTPVKLLPFSFERIEETFDSGPDVVCFSHLRWNFVYQRPQHLMSRFAREGRVFFVEEPLYTRNASAGVSMRVDTSGVCVVVPQVPEGSSPEFVLSLQRRLVDQMFLECGIRDCVLWYYTPMARAFTNHLHNCAIVYDCMDELSLFSNAPPGLREHEAELMRHADVVFTGGYSLYEAKRASHPNVYAEPSSIDVDHFKKARNIVREPADQAQIPRPRLGFAGVIDERMDLDLISKLAGAHPDWQLVLIGPVVKIDPQTLPQNANIHYLGQKAYTELPDYLSGWDVAIMPFARNDATRYISPTKTPEYLAAGKRVVSTSIRDVVTMYLPTNLVRIADDCEAFGAAIDESLAASRHQGESAAWLERVDAFLATTSWDRTWNSMMKAVERAISMREARANAS